MIGSRTAIVLAIVLTILVAILVVLARRESVREGVTASGGGDASTPTLLPSVPNAVPPPFSKPPKDPSAASPPGAPVWQPLDDAIRAGDAGAAQRAAAELRRLLRTDTAALETALAGLLDPATDRDLRRALAIVLGTVSAEGVDQALVDALAKFRDDAAFVADALLALGAQRTPPEDDDVFHLGDRPHGANAVGGLGITVRRGDLPPFVEKALAAHLARSEPAVRAAAAQALSQSMDRATARTAFQTALGSETADDVAARLGRPLADWAASSADEAQREPVLASLLSRAGGDGFDEYRFRLEEPLARAALSASGWTDLVAMTAPTKPFPVRSFALTVVAKAAERPNAGSTPARDVLLAALNDSDPAIRDLAARSLGRLGYDGTTAKRLAALARQDAAWNVRFTALESLAATAPKDEALPVLRAALRDADERVVRRAGELIARLEKPLR